MKQELFELSVAVPSARGGTKIPEFGHKGLTYVEGRAGQNYTIKLRNDSACAVLAVVSIDGLSVLDGTPCTPQSRGHVIPAYSCVEIDGWRTSLSEVHAFSFERKAKSYAKSMQNSTSNCGVISALIFSEKQPVCASNNQPVVIREDHHHYPNPPWVWPTQPKPWWETQPTCGDTPVCVWNASTVGTAATCTPPITTINSMSFTGSSDNSAGPAQSDIPDFKIGTGWGAAKISEVTTTGFDRDRHLATLTVYYAEAKDLKKAGVPMTKTVKVTPPDAPVLPQAFSGFCKPPVTRP